jgi:hypothetical protein
LAVQNIAVDFMREVHMSILSNLYRDEDDASKDRLIRDYDTVLKEGAILTSFAGILFGFLLNRSVRGANQ